VEQKYGRARKKEKGLKRKGGRGKEKEKWKRKKKEEGEITFYTYNIP
jgi:hypothetical protein